jgi:hypothetical protein
MLPSGSDPSSFGPLSTPPSTLLSGPSSSSSSSLHPTLETTGMNSRAQVSRLE